MSPKTKLHLHFRCKFTCWQLVSTIHALKALSWDKAILITKFPIIQKLLCKTHYSNSHLEIGVCKGNSSPSHFWCTTALQEKKSYPVDKWKINFGAENWCCVNWARLSANPITVTPIWKWGKAHYHFTIAEHSRLRVIIEILSWRRWQWHF